MLVESAMLIVESRLCLLLVLLASGIFSGLIVALHGFGRLQSEEELKRVRGSSVFNFLINKFFKTVLWEATLLVFSTTKQFLRIALLGLLFYQQFIFLPIEGSAEAGAFLFFRELCFISLLILATDALFGIVARCFPRLFVKKIWTIASWLVLLCLPITALFFLANYCFWRRLERAYNLPASLAGSDFSMKEKVKEILRTSELTAYLEPREQKLILSIVSFRDRIVREVMVPRIDMYSLPAETLVEDAVITVLAEGYSRIPIYRETIDQIIGVVHSKDLLRVYAEKKHEGLRLELLCKGVLYAPETKKISALLQEFLCRQTHLAIIVNEWGGTEGLVTIEDVLEELVGEISDEYDEAQQQQFSPHPEGGWIIDAKMSIFAIQEEVDIAIPQEAEYDTIGGYVFHKAGTVPLAGWKLHHDDFELEVLNSSERAIEKIWLRPLTNEGLEALL